MRGPSKPVHFIPLGESFDPSGAPTHSGYEWRGLSTSGTTKSGWYAADERVNRSVGTLHLTIHRTATNCRQVVGASHDGGIRTGLGVIARTEEATEVLSGVADAK